MNILLIKTDQPDVHLALYKDSYPLDEIKWHAGRNLSKDINIKIEDLLKKQNLSYEGLNGIVFFAGPGSFTGLRIGASVANAIAYGLSIPIIKTNGDGWIEEGVKSLKAGEKNQQISPEYGAPPKTTRPRK